ncbi:DUF302 domain-containing protein [uncultured Litoreibacter sp.]|uniref:DUF302 domain-containing protein n=1 Tax=uncultured Litoreibacter sp. TaxID=1392394 RepID=UPI00261A24AF|nr:DUF302 domain-containing protein [uncultured Litoreibacter sp.]
MKALLTSFVLSIGAAMPAFADLVTVSSPKSVTETADALAAAIEGAGAKVVARVDHQKAAAGADLEMGEAQVLIFGNPKIGTPAMQADIRSALYLPLKVLVYADADGKTQLTYDDPAAMFEELDIPADAEFLKVMTGALGKLTAKAAE